MNKFDFLKVGYDISFVESGLSPGVHFRALVEKGVTYAGYFHHANNTGILLFHFLYFFLVV